VHGIVGATDPYEAVRQTLEREKYDEVIVSTLPERVSRWLHLDLAHRIERFGVPVSIPGALAAPGVRTRNTFAYPKINDLEVLFLMSVVTADQAERTLLPGTGSV
jgi:hypothetical protein